MTKHTPGPWENLGTIVQAPGIFSAELLPASAPDRPVSADEIEANARLIAAAPDLLEAVAPFRNFIDVVVRRDDATTGVRLTYEQIRRILAAITKAEGKV